MNQDNFIVVTSNPKARDEIKRKIHSIDPQSLVSGCITLKGLHKLLTDHMRCQEDNCATIYIDAALYPKISECMDHLASLWVLESKLKGKKFHIFVFSDDEGLLWKTGLPNTHLVHINKADTT